MPALRDEGGPLIVGILPALGSGLTDLKRSGQHERLLGYDLAHYAKVADEVRYFSYFDERLADFTADPRVLARVRVYPKPRGVPPRAYATLMPLLLGRALAECRVVRVEQFTGVLPALLTRLLHGRPFVVTYGYDYDTVAEATGAAWKRWYFEWLRRIALPRAAGIIVPNPELRDRLQARWPGARYLDVPNGVDVAQFAPAAHGADGREVPTVLYVGRLSAEKNLLRLVEAVARIGDASIRLALVGDGPMAPHLAERARAEHVRLELMGVVPHHRLPALFAQSDCFVLPSLTEGHPKALIEAMSCGMACAVSDRGGNRLLVRDGDTGLRFDPEDVVAMAGCIRRLLTDRTLAARLGKAARERMLADYDIHRLMEREIGFVLEASGAHT
jgi:glycosyltransferase involved in cell wall biosynthesis